MAMNKHFEEIEPAREEINLLEGPAVVEFGAPWCGFCIAAQPLLAKAFEAYPHIRHIKIEDGSGRPLGRSVRVKLWPTLVFLRDGREVVRLVRPGAAKEISQALAQIDGITPEAG